MSMISAPSRTAVSTARSAASSVKVAPRSKNESGVRLTIAMTASSPGRKVRLPSRNDAVTRPLLPVTPWRGRLRIASVPRSGHGSATAPARRRARRRRDRLWRRRTDHERRPRAGAGGARRSGGTAARRPLAEADIAALRFDTALRGYRMAQVDAALRRTAYDLGYKEELITVLMAEVDALRAGRRDDADLLREARDQALVAAQPAPASEPAIVIPAGATDADTDADTDAEIDAEIDADEAVEAERAAEHAAERTAGDSEAGEPPDWSAELDDSWRRSAMGGR